MKKNQDYSELDKNEVDSHQNTKKMQKDEKKIKKIEEKDKKELKRDVDKARKRSKSYKGAVIGLAISTGVLSLSTIGLGIAYGVNMSMMNDYSVQLENIYNKNYYELVDSVNSADANISKLLASESEDYQAKLLTEIAREAQDMQANIASLPLSGENVLDCVRFINQMSGYTQTLEEKLVQGETLTDDDLQTLNEMHETLTEMKLFLNELSSRMMNGYSILSASNTSVGDLDQFTSDFAGIKAGGTDYPSMIYDGPFSDSVVNSQIKGLSGEEVTSDEAYSVVDQIFKNVSGLTLEGETNGKFSTYNFALHTSDNNTLFVQVTKTGGYLLTVSGQNKSDSSTISSEQAEKIALDFAELNGIENPEIVWSVELESQLYLNIAPVQDGIVLYPDLVKVKVDMENGVVIGYDAISYYTNHTDRDLSTSGIGIDLARESVDDSFTIVNQRTVLAPLEYNREVVCYEYTANRDGATYYLYYNILTGKQENILKVLSTTEGSKLM